jgi:hypothetical protein
MGQGGKINFFFYNNHDIIDENSLLTLKNI